MKCFGIFWQGNLISSIQNWGHFSELKPTWEWLTWFCLPYSSDSPSTQRRIGLAELATPDWPAMKSHMMMGEIKLDCSPAHQTSPWWPICLRVLSRSQVAQAQERPPHSHHLHPPPQVLPWTGNTQENFKKASEAVRQMKVKVRSKADQGLPESLALPQVHLWRLFGRSSSPILVQLPSWRRRSLLTISTRWWWSELALDTNQ